MLWVLIWVYNNFATIVTSEGTPFYCGREISKKSNSLQKQKMCTLPINIK